MFSAWPIRNKLYLGIGLLLVLLATLFVSGLYATFAYRNLVKALSSRSPELPLASQLLEQVSELRIAADRLESAAHIRPPNKNNANKNKTDSNKTETPSSEELFLEKLAQVQEALRDYHKQIQEPHDYKDRFGDRQYELQMMTQIESSVSRIEQTFHEWRDSARPRDPAQIKDELEIAHQATVGLAAPLHKKFFHLAGEVRNKYHALIWIFSVTAAAAAVMLYFLLRIFYHWVFQPIKILIQGSRRVAAGQFDYRIQLDSQDEMRELASALNDMTDRFQTIRDDLDRQVQERTKQVVRSEQLASVGFLAAGVAHEINNPLASIALCAESLEGRLIGLLEEGNADHHVVRQYLRMIQTEAFRCKEITEKLLDFSRIGEFKRSNVDLRGLIQEVMNLVKHVGKYQGRKIAFAEGPPVIAYVNTQEIKQVVLNILTNSLDSLSDGGTVSVELAEKNRHAEILFTDDGCGMTRETLAHLYEPFFTRRRGGQGTGLGLSITYRIVIDHGGQIEADSAGLDRGSQFRVKLPLAASQTDLNKKESSHRNQAA